MAIEIQELFHEQVRAAVKKVCEKYLRTPNLKALYDWFENDCWDEIVMSGLGTMFIYGQGVEEKVEIGICWLKKSAEQDNRIALRELTGSSVRGRSASE